MIERVNALASENRRYALPGSGLLANRERGYLRRHAMLRREGLVENRKRTHRLYVEQGLQVRTKKRSFRRSTAFRLKRPNSRCRGDRSTS